LICLVAGLNLSGAGATLICASGILVFGLPHGALDIELLRSEAAGSAKSIVSHVAIYLALAGLTYATWYLQPVFALILFLAIATQHFAEDWAICDAPLLAYAMSLASLVVPVLFHRSTVIDLFVLLTNDPKASFVAELMVLVAPVALLTATVTIALLINLRRFAIAVNAIATLIAMIALPPLIGFAISFCLIHSPLHIANNIKRLRRDQPALAHGKRIMLVMGFVTFAALGVTALIFAFDWHPIMSDRLIAATFIVLSVLTVPHMLLPSLSAGRMILSLSSLPSGHKGLLHEN
jgi:beta-carotene 15,15'-dioxygenase